MTTIKADETHKIQSENLNLNKAVSPVSQCCNSIFYCTLKVLCMRALGNWHSNQTALANKRQVRNMQSTQPQSCDCMQL